MLFVVVCCKCGARRVSSIIKHHQRMSLEGEESICLCGIPRLEQRQQEIYHRINGFCNEIIKVFDDELKTEKYDKLSIPKVIINEILSFSNHKQIQSLWISIFHKLRQYSFMIKDPCTLQQIQEFESKCKLILGNPNYELPDFLRISYLLANSVEIPPVINFNEATDSKYISNRFHPETIIESYMSPLTEWTRDRNDNYPYSWQQEICGKTILYNLDDECYDRWHWFDTNSPEYNNIFQIGLYFSNEAMDPKMGIFDGDSVGELYFNIKTNEVLWYVCYMGEVPGTHCWTIEEFQNCFQCDHAEIMYEPLKFEELIECDEYLEEFLGETREEIEKDWKLQLSEKHVETPFFSDFMDVFIMMVGDYLDKKKRRGYVYGSVEG